VKMRMVSEVDCKTEIITVPFLSLAYIVDYAVAVAHEAIFHNAAQICFAASRTFVHAKIYDEFIAKRVALGKKRVVGNPSNDHTEQGPQVNCNLLDDTVSVIEWGSRIIRSIKNNSIRRYTISSWANQRVRNSNVVAKKRTIKVTSFNLRCSVMFPTKWPSPVMRF
jgi:hypothetical protein